MKIILLLTFFLLPNLAQAQSCVELFRSRPTFNAETFLQDEARRMFLGKISPTKQNLSASAALLTDAPSAESYRQLLRSLTETQVRTKIIEQLRTDPALLLWQMSFSKQMESVAVAYFVKNLRVPTYKELAETPEVFFKQPYLEVIIPDLVVFWQTAIGNNPRKLTDAQNILTRAYNDFLVAMRKTRISPRSATIDELFNQLLSTYPHLKEAAGRGAFEVKHLQRLLGERSRRENMVPYPVLFEGLEGVRIAAKEKYPNSFKGLRDQKYGQAYNQETLNQIIHKYKGFIATFYLGGISFIPGQWAAMKAMAEKNDYMILIKEGNGETDLIPAEILANPRVRVITQTLDLGNELRVWGGLPIIPTNKNSLSGLMDRAMARVRGQTQIVFSPQQAMTPVATEKNHITGTHQVWSTGSMNEAVYPYPNLRSARVTTLASERHDPGVLVIEKSDRFSGPRDRGAPGRWHIRNVRYEQAISDAKYGSFPDGMIDKFIFYPGDGTAPRPVPAVGAVPGDWHQGYEDARFVKAIVEQVLNASRMAGAPVEYLRLHDYQDYFSANHYDGPGERAHKFQTGELSLQAESNAGRANLNALMALEPNLRVVLSSADNHMMWPVRQLESREAIDDPVNGPLLLRLRVARDQGIDVIDYLYRLQREFDSAIPDSVIRDRLLSSNVYIEDPSRILVLRRGTPFEIGPDGRSWNAAQHGDVIAGGKRGGASLEPHGRANDRVIVGHVHSAAVLGLTANPGMVIRLRSQKYALGPYSSQENAIMVIYPNGAGQLLFFDPQVGRLYADPTVGPIQGDGFFTSKPFVVEDPNNLVEEGVTVLTNYNDKPAQ